MEGNKRNIVIEGVGGIGKTVTLFSVMNIEDDILSPAVYVPMHKLIDENGNCTNLSDYLKSLSNTYGEKIIELAESSWVNSPKLLVMMDGFNEVPGTMRRRVLYMLNEWYKSNLGAQLIVVSRPMDGVNLKSELNGKPLSITLEPLSVDIVRDYLGDRTPPKSSRVWEILTRPLFLNLYIKTDCLTNVTADGYFLRPKPSESGGALIWNYLQRELLREKDSDKCEQWVLRCSIACEYILPYIAFRMEREHRFTIERKQAIEYIKEVISDFDPQKLPDHLSEIYDEYASRHFEYPDLIKCDWNNTVFNDIGLLKADKKSYAFLHQNFRDALAGLFLVNQAEMMENDETLPEVWRRAANHYVMDYAAELIEDRDADKLWEANRKASPTDSSATYAMMELQRRRTNKSDPKLDFGLDFSGMDLRGISLTRYMKDGNKNESSKIAMRLFGSPQLSRGTKFDINTFRSPGHIGPINCVAATEDGLCVSGSWDKTLRVWDIRTGECLHTMVGHTDSIYCVSVSENGLCVSASGDKTLRIWDMYSGDCLRVIHSDNDVFRCSNISKDWICLSGSRNSNLCVWNVRTGQRIRTLTGHTDWVTGVVTVNSDLCVSGSDDKTVRIWNINTDKCLHTLKEHTARVNCVAVTHDGLCVSGAEDNTILVWDIYTGKLIRNLTGHADWVRCVAVTEDDLCISGSYDGTMRVWDIHTGECLRKMEGHTGVVCSVAVTEGGLCISGSWDNTMRVWDIHTGECLRIIRGQSGWVSFAVSTKNGFRISGIGDRCLRVIDVRTGERCHIMRGHTSWVNCICLANDGLCVSGSDDRTIRVWDYNAGECLQTLEGHTAWVKCVAVTDDGLCVSGSGDHTLRVWDMKTGECLRTMGGHDHQVNCVAVTKDGKCISGSDDRTLRVWDIQTRECLHVLEGHTDSVYRVTVTNDGLCISESDDETVRKWNIRTGECIDVRYPMEIETAGMVFTEANLTPKLAKALWQNNAAIPTADYEQYVKPDTSLIKND